MHRGPLDQLLGLPDPARQSGRMLKRRIAAFSASIIVAICALVTEVVIRERSTALKSASSDAANLSAGFEAHARGTLHGVVGALQVLKQRIEKEGLTFALAEWKDQVPELSNPAVQIAVLDRDGKLIATSAVHNFNQPVYLSDREYFRVHRDNANAGVFIGRPVQARVTQQGIMVPVTKRLNTADGEFAGVLVFSLNPEYLVSFQRGVNLGETGSLDIMGTDGFIRARYTGHKLDIENMGKSEPLAPWKAGSAQSGQYAITDPQDGIERLHHWRRVSGYPLIVDAGIGKEEALAPACSKANLVIGLGAIAITLPLIMLVMLSREISRRVNHEIALYGERDKLRSEHAAVLAMSAQLAEERIKLGATNAQLVSTRRRAEEASRAKSIFLANISHELRTPLNAIIGFAQMIRDRVYGDDTHRYAEYADDIYRSGRHLLCIINGLLDMAKIEAGKLKLDETLMKLDEIVRECMGAVQSLAAKSKIELNVNLPASGLWLRADETKLKQIIINLLSNAVKFTPAGGKVTFSAKRDQDGGLILTISDTGIGMSPEEAQCALELFRQLDNPMSRRCEGTGLGLPLAVQLTELHGGSFKIESLPGSGTSIFIRLPADRVAWEDGPPSTKTCVQPPL